MAPHFSESGDPSRDSALGDVSSECPLVECGFDPVRNGHGADVTTLADQINYGPVPLALLEVLQFQTDEFRPAKTAPEQPVFNQALTSG